MNTKSTGGRSGEGGARKVALGILLGFPAIGLLVFLAAGLLPPPMPRTAGGLPRLRSLYVEMPDGVRLAVRVMLPASLGPGGRAPAILEATRYSTLIAPRLPMRALTRLGLARIRSGEAEPRVPDALDYARAAANGRAAGGAMEAFLEAGYAYVAASARGTGASFGRRPIECSREEVADLAVLVDWIAAQSWCDGRVGSYGVSYAGNTAELAAAVAGEALLAAAPLYSDYDPVAHNALPGGILNERLVEDWNAGNLAADAAPDRDLLFDAAPPVDGPGGAALRRAAFRSHGTADLAAALRGLGSPEGELAPGYRAADIAPASFRSGLEASGRPLHVRVGWLDAATVNGALERYLRSPGPQELVIGPWGHGGLTMRDPLLEGGGPAGARPGRAELEAAQSAELLGFFGRAMGGGRIGRSLRYYTFGEGAWKTSPTWPPAGFEPRRLWLGPGKSLAVEPPREAGADGYEVDFSAASGASSRWRTNLGGGEVDYPDRASADQGLLVYDSAPLETDLEITGVPELCLWLESSREDGALFAYLEALGPEGQVVYLTEGLLRLSHRRLEEDGELGGALGPRHGYRAREAAPLLPGEAAEVRLAMQATSVLLRAGWRLRLALAGHDASNFARIPAEGEAELRVHRGAELASRLELPARER